MCISLFNKKPKFDASGRDYKKKNEGGFAPVKVMMTTDDLEVILAKVQKQREQIEEQKQEIAEQRKQIQEMIDG